jgi:primosomal protein N'
MYQCPDCGYTAEEPGDCPTCGIPLVETGSGKDEEDGGNDDIEEGTAY